MPMISVCMDETVPSINISALAPSPTVKASRLPLGFNVRPLGSIPIFGSGISDGTRVSGSSMFSGSNGVHDDGSDDAYIGSSSSDYGGGSSSGFSGGSIGPLSSFDLVLNALLQNMGQMKNRLVSLSQASSQPIFQPFF